MLSSISSLYSATPAWKAKFEGIDILKGQWENTDNLEDISKQHRKEAVEWT